MEGISNPTTTALRVTILDDEHLRAETWKARIGQILGENVSVTCATGETLLKAIKGLNIRRESWTQRLEHDSTQPALDSCVEEFDGCDVVLVDYNVRTQQELAATNGQALAYLIRSCSTAKCVIVVNQYDWRFDLSRVAERDEHSAADFAFGDEGDDLFSPWLWQRERNKTEDIVCLEPVDCPTLSKWPNSLARLAGALLDWVRAGTADMPDEVLPENVRSAISPAFWDRLLPGLDFQSGSELLPVTWYGLRKSRLVSEKGEHELRRPPEVESLMAASAILRWLRTTVLPPQDSLVDKYRLAERLGIVEPGEGVEDVTTESIVERVGPAALPADIWPEPMWVWPDVQASVWSNRNTDAPPIYLLEDTGRYVARADAQPVRTDLAGAFSRRWVTAATAPWVIGTRVIRVKAR